jgi:hypothetical protein
MPRASSRHPIARGATLVLATAGLAIACGRSATEPDADSEIATVAAQVAQVAAAVTGQKAPLADAQQEGKVMGFDTHTYPGDETMAAWKAAPGAPYRWVGFYLPAPCHKDRSWSGKRQTLVDMGWGLAVVYVGQQTWGRTPRPTAARIARLLKSGKTCNADLVSAERGAVEGADAVAAAEAEGFPRGSIVFLDIERMEKMPGTMRDYYRAWSKHLLADGRYRPGIYVHAHNAQAVYDDVKAEFVAAGLVDEEPRMWVASGRGFEEGKAPQDVGFAFAGVWQGMIDVARTVADIRLPLDVNVSTWTSPSEPDQPAPPDRMGQ